MGKGPVSVLVYTTYWSAVGMGTGQSYPRVPSETEVLDRERFKIIRERGKGQLFHRSK